MKPFHTLGIKDNPVFIRHLDSDTLGIITKEGKFTLYDASTLKPSKQISTPDSLSRLSRTSLISKDGRYAACMQHHGSEMSILHLPEKRAVGKVTHDGNILTCASIDPDCHYLATGGEDGRVSLWNLEDAASIAKLTSHPDFVSLVGFSPDRSFIISCGYEGGIVITRYTTEDKPHRLRVFERTKITAMAFLSDFRVALGSERGDLVILDFVKLKILREIKLDYRPITHLICSHDSRLLITTVKGGQIGLIDTKELKVLSSKLFDTGRDVASLEVSPHRNVLYVALEENEIQCYEVHNESELKDYVNRAYYRQAHEMAEENPLLKTTQTYEKLLKIWEKSFRRAQILLDKKQNKEAQRILGPFKEIPSKKSYIIRLLQDYRRYPDLEQFILAKNFASAYALVQKSTYLSYSSAFLSLEKLWRAQFQKAEYLMFTQGDKAQVQTMLSPFYRVPEKSSLILNLLRNPGVFKESKKRIRDKDIKGFFALVAKHPFLKNAPIYADVMEYGEDLMKGIRYKIKERQFKDVLDEIDGLMYYRHLREDTKDIREFASHAHLFLDHYRKKELLTCYSIMDSYPEILDFPEAIELESAWKEQIRDAHSLVLRGDIPALVDRFESFFSSPSRRTKIGNLFKRTYLSQILNAAKTRQLSDSREFERAIQRCVLIFGFDEIIEDVISELNECHGIELLLAENILDKNRQTDWYKTTRGNLPDSIFSELPPPESEVGLTE